MNAAEALCNARYSGVHVGIAGTDLILDADQEPAPQVLAELRRHKEDIVALLTTFKGDWAAEDWQVFFDERAGIAEYDGGLTPAAAEARAFECCIAEWLIQNPIAPDSGRCAWCGQSKETSDCVVIPFETESHGHTWLHQPCWNYWLDQRRAEARHMLTAFGIEPRI
jgi:hypothetical protein